MAHNLNQDGRTWVKAILTIADIDNDTITFTPRPWGDGLMVKAKSAAGQIAEAIIQGQDLFALREFLLNEVDESEFVRPPDPVEIPDWVEGDCILRQYPSLEGRVYFLHRGIDDWSILGHGSNPTWRATDHEINATLAVPDRIDRPKHTVLRRGGRRVD